jgi:hypothetical protein
MTLNNESLITVAGSGPSSKDYNKKVTIATKKVPCDSEYIYLPHIHFYHTLRNRHKDKPILIRRRRCLCKKCRDCSAPYHDVLKMQEWWKYYEQFNPKNRKPSIGTEAVWFAIQLWRPETIGVIGLDGVLDGEGTDIVSPHDVGKERLSILSLVNIKDLRNDTIIRRIRPPRGVSLPRFLSKCN